MTYETNAPKVCSGVSCWMFAILVLAVFQTCSTGLCIGSVRRQENGCDAFQQLPWPVEAGQGFGMVEPRIVQHDSEPVGLGFAL